MHSCHPWGWDWCWAPADTVSRWWICWCGSCRRWWHLVRHQFRFIKTQHEPIFNFCCLWECSEEVGAQGHFCLLLTDNQPPLEKQDHQQTKILPSISSLLCKLMVAFCNMMRSSVTVYGFAGFLALNTLCTLMNSASQTAVNVIDVS